MLATLFLKTFTTIPNWYLLHVKFLKIKNDLSIFTSCNTFSYRHYQNEGYFNFASHKPLLWYHSTFSGVASHCQIIVLFWNFWFRYPKKKNFQQNFHLNLKISTCYLPLMFYANVLLHGIGFDPKSSLTWNMALTIGIPSSTKKQGLFFTFIAYIKSKRKIFLRPCNKIM